MARVQLQVRVSHVWAARHQHPVSGARPQLFQLSFARERTATDQQHQGLSPLVKSTQSPSFGRAWRPTTGCKKRNRRQEPGAEQRTSQTTTDQHHQGQDHKPRSKHVKTTPRQETDNLEISVQVVKPFVLRTRRESQDPEAFPVYCSSKSLADNVTLEILLM